MEGQAAAAPSSQLSFSVKDAGGNTQTLNDHELLAQLSQQGYQPLGISKDGQTVTMQDQQGPYDVKLDQVFKNLGSSLESARPVDADYSNIQHGWRALVNKLPDDAQRKEVLEQLLINRGVKNPVVMGSGRDWFVHNPHDNFWMGVTNHPDWDSSDLVEAGLEVPRALGAGVAGGAAAIAGGGVASIPAGMVGAAAGGAGVDALERAALAGISPEYRDVVGRHMGDTGMDIAKGAAGDAAGFALPAVGGKIARAVAPELSSLLKPLASPVSSAAKAGGAAARVGGQIASGAAGMADNATGRNVASFLIPGLSEADTAAFLAQAPSQLVRGAAKLPGWIGERKAVGEASPAIAEKLTRLSRNLLRDRGAAPGPGLAEEAAGLMRGTPKAPENMTGYSDDVRNIIGNAFDDATRVAQRGRAPAALRDSYREARRYGLSPQEAHGIGSAARDDMIGQVQASGQRAGRIGEHVGDVFHLAEEGGRQLGRAVTATAGAGIKGVKYGGAVAHRLGQGAEALGTLAQPLEPREVARYGFDKAVTPYLEELRERRRRDMMGATLAAQ